MDQPQDHASQILLVSPHQETWAHQLFVEQTLDIIVNLDHHFNFHICLSMFSYMGSNLGAIHYLRKQVEVGGW